MVKTKANRVMSLILAIMILPFIAIEGTLTHVSAEDDFLGHGGNREFLTEIVPVTSMPDFDEYISIETCSELEKIGNDSNYPLSGKYYLKDDIDLAGIEWIPIGTYGEPFFGIFDGQGHAIKNLTITNMDSGVFEHIYADYSLFGVIYAYNYDNSPENTAIRNLALEEVNIALNIGALRSGFDASVLWQESHYVNKHC